MEEVDQNEQPEFWDTKRCLSRPKYKFQSSIYPNINLLKNHLLKTIGMLACAKHEVFWAVAWALIFSCYGVLGGYFPKSRHPTSLGDVLDLEHRQHRQGLRPIPYKS